MKEAEIITFNRRINYKRIFHSRAMLEQLLSKPDSVTLEERNKDKRSDSERPGDPPKRILLVDDEDEPRELLRDALHLLGYQVVTATNGVEALEKLAAQDVDLVISDIYMHRMDGLTLLKTMRERDIRLPVIFITGFDPVASHQKAAEYGAYALLQKPFRLNSLKALLAEIFHNAHNSVNSQSHR